jgi:hypothetical protein
MRKYFLSVFSSRFLHGLHILNQQWRSDVRNVLVRSYPIRVVKRWTLRGYLECHLRLSAAWYQLCWTWQVRPRLATSLTAYESTDGPARLLDGRTNLLLLTCVPAGVEMPLTIIPQTWAQLHFFIIAFLKGSNFFFIYWKVIAEPGTEAHACDLNYLGNWDREECSLRPAAENSS